MATDMFSRRVMECLPVCDNIRELTRKFYVVRLKEEWLWYCKKCQKSVISVEILCNETKNWITYRLRCIRCGATWRAGKCESVKIPIQEE